MHEARKPGQRSQRAIRRIGLIATDVVAINLAFCLAYWLRYGLELGGPIHAPVPFGAYLPWGVALTPLLLVAFRLEGLYSQGRRQSMSEILYAIATGTIVGVAILTVLLYGFRPIAQSRLMLSYAAGLIIASVGMARWINILLRQRALRRGIGVQQVLIVGAGELGRAVMRNIMAQPDLGYRIVGFLDDDPDKRGQPIGRFVPLGTTDGLSEVLRRHPVDQVILTLPWRAREQIVRLVDDCEQQGIQTRIVPDLFQMSLNRVDLASLGGIPLISVRAPALRGWHHQIKRTLDVLLSLLLLFLFSPVLLLLALAIRIESEGPVLFRQSRMGRDGRLFTCFKFRSMVEGADAARERLRPLSDVDGPIFKMREDPRITRVGRFIRRFSLDELPQLFNVVVGDMSLVGPRPPMPIEVESYAEWHHRRLDVAPGLTGLWQVSGRSDLTFDEMVMLDLFYAENWSLGMDLKILLRTVPTVLRGTGAY
jgi:exopolysaccharide biosynthesis polyprenyl glycosylphosphotransferase